MIKCDRCNQAATVHEMSVVDGVKVQTHLCESCARAAGLSFAPGGAPPGTAAGLPPVLPPTTSSGAEKITAVPAIAGQFIVTTRSGQRTIPRVCRGCGLAFADFRQTGVLGCAECYESFAEQLEGLIARSHAGATSHTGRRPRRSADAAQKQDRVRRLLRDLHEAVTSEQFERAARIRDELRALNVDPAARATDGAGSN